MYWVVNKRCNKISVVAYRTSAGFLRESYLDDITAVASIGSTGEGCWICGEVDVIRFAAVVIFGFDDFINSFALANLIERRKLKSIGLINLSVGQPVNANVSAAVASHGILFH